MRIIAGKHKGRKINIPKDRSARPTRPMIREALFNILSSGEFIGEDGVGIIQNATILDLFAGSGSFAIEALSRGARKAILVDNNKDNLSIARSNLEAIGELENSYLIGCDIEKLSTAKTQVDLAFIDPPYHQNLVEVAIKKLIINNWLKDGSVVIIETDAREQYELPANFTFILKKEYGSTKVAFYRFI